MLPRNRHNHAVNTHPTGFQVLQEVTKVLTMLCARRSYLGNPYSYQTSCRPHLVVWRLLYLHPVVEDDLYYNYRPFTPWEQYGNTSMQNCVLRVVAHLRCKRHHLHYQHWTALELGAKGWLNR